jgi:hypothetical protein
MKEKQQFFCVTQRKIMINVEISGIFLVDLIWLMFSKEKII